MRFSPGNKAKAFKLSACSILFVFLLAWLHTSFRYEGIDLSLITDADEGDSWSVYYDKGDGFNDFDVISKRVNRDGIVRFELPRRPIASLRIDPGNRAGNILLQEICLEIPSKQPFCWMPDQIQENFMPLHDISVFEEVDGKLLIRATGTDPYFFLKKGLPIHNRKGKIVYVYYLSALLLSILAYWLFTPAKDWFVTHKAALYDIVQLRWDRKIINRSGTALHRALRLANLSRVFLIVFLYFLFWAIVNPPGQAPDEIAHFIKALSVPEYPWRMPQMEVETEKNRSNPILKEEKIYLAHANYTVKFSGEDYIRMKSLEWPEGTGTIVNRTSAYSYPNLYYLILFLPSHVLIGGLNLSPFNAFFVYRIVSAFFAALLWMWTYGALSTIRYLQPFGQTLFWGTVLIPMSGFISSSINPDAFVIPLTHIFMIYSFHALVSGRYLLSSGVVFLISLFVKPSSILLFPVIILLSIATAILKGHWSKSHTRFTAVTALAFLLSQLGFYFWSAPVLHGSPVHTTMGEYIHQLPHRIPHFFIMYEGVLGCLEYRLDHAYYMGLFVIIMINTVFFLCSYRVHLQMKWPLYALSFSILFCAGVIAGEYYYLPKAGYTIQGRYFLPVSIGLSVFLIHRALLFRYIYIAFLVLLNAALFHEHLIRYFGLRIGNYLPFF